MCQKRHMDVFEKTYKGDLQKKPAQSAGVTAAVKSQVRKKFPNKSMYTQRDVHKRRIKQTCTKRGRCCCCKLGTANVSKKRDIYTKREVYTGCSTKICTKSEERQIC